MKLFEDEWGVDNSPIDETEITTTILYFSTDELKQFKHLCRLGIKKEFQDKFQQKGNLSNFLLLILKRHYEES